MAISPEACKNLINTLQKLDLAATAVSVALLSNAFLSPDRTTEKARDELQQVMRIKEQVAAVSMNECVNEEIQATGTQFEDSHKDSHNLQNRFTKRIGSS
jgi:hypothetical protein